jgi:glutathione S-transferase
MSHKLELVSFALCPFVQRAVVMLKMKKAPFTTTYIDLAQPPAWFKEISPLGKVPLLKVDDKHIIFESAVINELIDETIAPPFFSREPIERATERAWIEYGSTLLMEQGGMMREKDPTNIPKLKAKFLSSLARVEGILSQGPFFRGKQFSLIDAAYAPLFMRLSFFPELWNEAFAKSPKTKAWAENLIQLDEVRESVIPDYKERYFDRMREMGSALLAA